MAFLAFRLVGSIRSSGRGPARRLAGVSRRRPAPAAGPLFVDSLHLGGDPVQAGLDGPALGLLGDVECKSA